jgi:hypothetical protein
MLNYSNKGGNPFILSHCSIGWNLLFHFSVGLANMKNRGEEIRHRLPRLVTNLIMTIIFWIISVFVPPTLPTLIIPGINVGAHTLVWILTMVIMVIFLIRALTDALVLGDILTDAITKKLGIKEEKSSKRAAKEIVYIIVVVLVVTAIAPLLETIENVGIYLSAVIVYFGLGVIILFIYDIGRTVYKIIEDKAESFADYVSQTRQDKRSE